MNVEKERNLKGGDKTTHEVVGSYRRGRTASKKTHSKSNENSKEIGGSWSG